MIPDTKIRRTITLRRDLAQRLDAISDASHVHISTLLTVAVESYLNEAPVTRLRIKYDEDRIRRSQHALAPVEEAASRA